MIIIKFFFARNACNNFVKAVQQFENNDNNQLEEFQKSF